MAEALTAQAWGADYLGVSPIFSTTTKADAGAPTGVALLAEIRRRVSLPLVAIGGITLANAPAVIAAGADAVCAISAVVTKADVAGRRLRSSRGYFGHRCRENNSDTRLWSRGRGVSASIFTISCTSGAGRPSGYTFAWTKYLR